MSWVDLIPLIVRFGPDWVAEFWRIVQAHPEPSAAAFDALKAIAVKPYDLYISEAQERARRAAAQTSAPS